MKSDWFKISKILISLEIRCLRQVDWIITQSLNKIITSHMFTRHRLLITWWSGLSRTEPYAGHGRQLCHQNWCSGPSNFNLCEDHVNNNHKTVCWSWMTIMSQKLMFWDQWLQSLRRSRELVYEKVSLTKIDVLGLTAPIFAKITWIAIIRHYAGCGWQSCHKNWCSELAMIGVLSSVTSIFAGITWITINWAE